MVKETLFFIFMKLFLLDHPSLLLSYTPKRKVSCGQEVEAHPDRPYIYLGSFTRSLEPDFRCCIMGRTVLTIIGSQSGCIRSGITKIDKVDVIVGIDQNIFQLDIMVDKVVTVNMIQCCE